MTSFRDFLRDHPLMQTLPASVQEQVLTQVQGWKYRMGQPLSVANQTPDHVIILYQGVVRSLFLDPRSQKLVTLERLAPGAVVGWLGVLRQQACETVMAAEEAIGLTLPAAVFRELWQTQPAFRDYFSQEPTAVERAELIRGALAERAQQTVKMPLREWVRQLEVKLITLAPGPLVLPEIPHCRWWVSLGQ